jgi:hypothetical protein
MWLGKVIRVHLVVGSLAPEKLQGQVEVAVARLDMPQ